MGFTVKRVLRRWFPEGLLRRGFPEGASNAPLESTPPLGVRPMSVFRCQTMDDVLIRSIGIGFIASKGAFCRTLCLGLSGS